MRFHGMVRTDVPARHLVEAGGVDRLALICRHGDRVVAVASYDRLLEPGVAEVAFAVAEDFRRRWTATRLLEQLAAIAAERGIRRFVAEVLADNRAALGVFKKAGFAVRREGAGGEVTVVLDITPTESVWERIDERDHQGAVASLRAVLAPRSIAIVGASDARNDPGGAVLSNVIDGHFRGLVTPINAAGGVIRSIPVAPSIAGLEEAPELVVIAVPATELVEVAREAAEKGAKALIVLRGGPADEGDQAREWEELLLEVVRGAGMRLVGPNCLGLLNTDPRVSLNATFAGFRVPAGRLAICSESGAIGIALLGHSAARRLGVSSFASLGRRADVSTNDLLELWEEDSRTAVVMVYVETFGNPERFARIARRVARRKPILAIKGHRRPDATRSRARSHTSAALRGTRPWTRCCITAAFSGSEPERSCSTPPSSTTANRSRPDARSGSSPTQPGWRHSRPMPAQREDCSSRRPDGRVRNPLVMHIRAGPHDYATAARGILQDAGVDALMAFYVDPLGGDPEGVLEAISTSATGQRKPVVACVVTAEGELRTSRDRRRTELPLPRVLRGRPRPRRRAPRVALAANRRARPSTRILIQRPPGS